MKCYSNKISWLLGFCLFFYCLPNYAKTPPEIQLAVTYNKDINVSEYWVSEKLDGIRARWDGQQLISRGGKLFHAPAWFTAYFPAEVLDGELWIGRGRFEKTASVVLTNKPTVDWRRVKFMLFDLPHHPGRFSERLIKMKKIVVLIDSAYLAVIPQFRINNQKELMLKLDRMVSAGAEGLMLHHQDAYYQTKRNPELLKLKKYQDAEATVVAHIAGKGKYINMLGSLLVKLESGIKFKIGSGFSDLQRITPPPIGSVVTFKFYGKTANNIPRFASFIRMKTTAVDSNAKR
jgi:DNA ligase-1